jgi:hypothetical protein
MLFLFFLGRHDNGIFVIAAIRANPMGEFWAMTFRAFNVIPFFHFVLRAPLIFPGV